MKIKYGIAGALCIALALMAVEASAVFGTEVYHASECIKVGTSGTLGLYASGNLYNIAEADGEDLTLACPLERYDNNSAIFGDVEVVVHDNNSTEDVQCTIKCRDDNSTSAATDSDSNATEGSYVDLHLDPNSPYEYTNGACFLICVIPDSEENVSGIAMYDVEW